MICHTTQTDDGQSSSRGHASRRSRARSSSDGIRQLLRGLAVLQIMFAVWVLAMASAIVGSGVWLVVALFGLGIPAFYFYTLGRDDVRDWMFRKNFHVDDSNTDIPQL